MFEWEGPLTLDELENLEEEALRFKKIESAKLLRVAAALREALQAKANAEAMVELLRKNGDPGGSYIER